MTAVTDNPALFADLPPRRKSPLALRWLVVALVAHLVLLTVPESWWQEDLLRSEPRSVTVRLEVPTPPMALPEPAAEVPLPLETVPAVLVPEESLPVETLPEETPVDAAMTEREPPVEAPIEVVPIPDRPSALPETADASRVTELDIERLLEAVAAMDWSSPEATRAPSRDTSSEVLERLRTPVLSGENNRFDGMHAPAEVEIMDRWLGPDGTHEVVLRAPDGETYCGRQEPVNDLRPWLQMPMMFRKCAGGGKRSSGASWRNN